MPTKDPPHWMIVKEACDANPGRWVLATRDGHTGWANQITNGRLAAFRPKGAYKAISRNGNGVRSTIYVRRNIDGDEPEVGRAD